MSQKDKILAALKDGPKTNAWLADNICLRYGARIWELNNIDGYNITNRRVPKKHGLVIYELEGKE